MERKKRRKRSMEDRIVILPYSHKFLRISELCDRFEVPNPKNKWDRPLFTLKPEELTPLEDIRKQIMEEAEIVTRNTATEVMKVEEPDFLLMLDQITNDIIATVMDAQNTLSVNEVPIPKCSVKVIYRLFY